MRLNSFIFEHEWIGEGGWECKEYTINLVDTHLGPDDFYFSVTDPITGICVDADSEEILETFFSPDEMKNLMNLHADFACEMVREMRDPYGDNPGYLNRELY